MAIDPDLLSQARAAEARVIDIEHEADVARADFHHAIRRLQLAGGSLREIAAALGLSHQRVHQIVEAAGGSRRWRRHSSDSEGARCCSFCGRAQRKVRKLISGPGVYICETCVDMADDVLATGNAATTPTAAITPVSEEARTQRCSFCGQRRYEVSALASAGESRICTDCLRLCHEITPNR